MVALNLEKSKNNLKIVQREIQSMLDRKERITPTSLAKYTGFKRNYFYNNVEARRLMEEAQLQQGECYNPKKVIFDRVSENVKANLKLQVKELKMQIKELERQKEALEQKVKILEEENRKLKNS